MAPTVEVRHIGADLAGPLAEMRAWLARNKVPIIAIEHSTGGPGTAFRVSFHQEKAARAFAEAFNGRLEGQHPDGEELWRVVG